jgi:N-acetyl-gamma-glutamyl-phosphate reductase
MAVVGAAGYAGGELLRLLIHHPHCGTITAVSRSQNGQAVISIHKDLLGECDLVFRDMINGNEEIIFLCMAHGEAKSWISENHIDDSVLVIDLSQDFRYTEENFIYGLTEFNRENIRAAKRIANPGCFATVIQLMLLPLSSIGYLNNEVNITATTGSTGAGQTLTPTSHFTWRSNNHSSYKVLSHQHLFEIGETLQRSGANNLNAINIIPQRGAFSRGIHATAWIKADSPNTEEIIDTFKKYYANSCFVFIAEESPDVKQVTNTNKCFLHVTCVDEHIVITGVIDNLLKGASGQAIQNMNLALGVQENAGLQLKPIAY